MRHDSWLVCQSVLGVWGEKSYRQKVARKSPDMSGGKMGTKRVPVTALKVPYSSKCTVFRGEAVRDDEKSPNPLFGIETADFRVDIFGRFLVDFWGAPNKRKTATWWEYSTYTSAELLPSLDAYTGEK